MEITGLILPVLFAFSFLLGSVPFGLLVARVFKVKDLTARGSGNIGATNVTRVLGFWPAGALTLALDMLKGLLPVVLARPEAAELWTGAIGASGFELGAAAPWVAALFAVLGHCYSPWLHFKGGKGVATGFGAILILSPWAGLAGAAGFALAFLSKRIGSLASLTGIAVASIAHLVTHSLGIHLWAAAAMIFVILLRHEANIDALLENREKAF